MVTVAIVVVVTAETAAAEVGVGGGGLGPLANLPPRGPRPAAAAAPPAGILAGNGTAVTGATAEPGAGLWGVVVDVPALGVALAVDGVAGPVLTAWAILDGSTMEIPLDLTWSSSAFN